jgi:hypothetical protein
MYSNWCQALERGWYYCGTRSTNIWADTTNFVLMKSLNASSPVHMFCYIGTDMGWILLRQSNQRGESSSEAALGVWKN